MEKKELPSADKSLGQHFLRDQNIIQKVTDDYCGSAKSIIEIGPGPAILSESLSKKSLPYFVVEKDERMLDYLQAFLKDDNIFFADALEFPLQETIKQKEMKDCWLVSNLPYNVSVPLTLSFVQIPEIKFMSLMYQKEVAEKIYDLPKKSKKDKNEMGSLKALCQCYFDVNLLCKVPPGAFSPPPKVESAVLSFQRKDKPLLGLDEYRKFESFNRVLFAHKRKQIFGVLKTAYEEDKIEQALNSCQIEKTLRAERLELEQVVDLYHAITKA